MKARDKIRKWLLLCVAMAFVGGVAHAAELPSSPADTCRILAFCSPSEAGTITGDISGDYAIGTWLTFTAEANPGFYFSGWTNGFGEVVSVSKTYTFVVTYHCVLIANFTTQPGIGNLVTNADGSQGVLFYVNSTGTEGWMVALDDASPSCQWGDDFDVLALHEMPFQLPMALEDQSGYLNTSILRDLQAPESGYAATQVNFDNGWYLPSVGQLRKLYSALPFIEAAITDAGGTTLSDGTYWSSSEYSSSQAFSPAFALNNSNKGAGCHVRAIRNYVMAGRNVVAVASNDTSYGTVTGGGSYANGQTVTVTATPNAGYAFDHWSEDGVAVSYDAQYQFTFTRSRSLVAHFGLMGSVGSIIVNADGSKGVVFWQNPEGDEGLMVALEDASDGCNWGNDINALTLVDKPFQLPIALEDVSGNTNTRCIRKHLDTLSGVYAANVVDFENGWYLPSAGELRKLYAALPLIENALSVAGGVTLTNSTYWSSTEYATNQAATATFSMSNENTGSILPVRAIRHFSTAGPNAIALKANDAALGTLNGSGNYSYGQSVTVTATPNEGYTFNYWTENGMIVSYDAAYQFPFTRSRSLVAHFVIPGSVGSVVNNADGSKGVVFWQSPEGDEGLMMALEDASDGCAWGADPNALTLIDRPYTLPMALEDVSGNTNTRCILSYLDTLGGFAANVVDFEHGWYLPSVGELRKLYAALPQVEPVLLNAGGVMLTSNTYWSSTEYYSDQAATATFSMSNANKGSALPVRAIRHFSTAGPNAIAVKANDATLGTVSGSGNYNNGQTVTVTAAPNDGYAFNYWTENGMIVSFDAEYQFPFERSRSLVANFVVENSVGSVITNEDGSRGVIFHTDPTGIGGWMVALNDASEGCFWGENTDVPDLEDQNPTYTVNLLSDLDGIYNNRILRSAFEDSLEYAVNQTDDENGWYLPTAGQLRKLYAALPQIEPIILNAGGVMMTTDAYWSSTERNSNQAWSLAFEFSASAKGGNGRVRAIRNYLKPEVQEDHIFVGTNGVQWSEPGNWINPPQNLFNSTDDVIVATRCNVDADATVGSLTMAAGSTISVDEGNCLTATESISNTYETRINLNEGAQLVNPSENTWFTLKKSILGYANNANGGWYTIASPAVAGMDVETFALGNYDLYYYDEPTAYWINQKWENGGFDKLNLGQGYLYANSAPRTLTFEGQAKASHAEFSKPITCTALAYPLEGFNLVGNPYTNNISIYSLKVNNIPLTSYYKLQNDTAFVVYTNEPILPAEGFLVRSVTGNLNFNAAAKDATTHGYVRLVLYEAGKMLDRAYLKTTEGEGLGKMEIGRPSASLYFHQDDGEYAIAERQRGEIEYQLGFQTDKDGSFTITSDLLDTECSYLHLIDQLTGDDIDLLSTPSYTFDAKATDDTERFMLVFKMAQ
ncbi:MAG: DUF1566 domain-containing protein [Bacteroidales bacterium]|nr:DUF1566 domain-containing protein [Bacteroidales bacterium]